MLQKLLLFFLCFYVVTLFSGCATVIHGTNQKIAVNTIPTGAIITVDNDSTTYSTPTTIKLKRKVDHDLVITKEGYESEQIHIYHIFSMAIAGNLVLGGVTGIVTDSVDGAKSRLVPKSIELTLKLLGTGPNFPAGHTPEDRIKALDILKEQKMITESEYATLKKKLTKPEPKNKPPRTQK
jgi:hypothetical protein